jgi:hypothetical protein
VISEAGSTRGAQKATMKGIGAGECGDPKKAADGHGDGIGKVPGLKYGKL